jgi:hypothetical protein
MVNGDVAVCRRKYNLFVHQEFHPSAVGEISAHRPLGVTESAAASGRTFCVSEASRDLPAYGR